VTAASVQTIVAPIDTRELIIRPFSSLTLTCDSGATTTRFYALARSELADMRAQRSSARPDDGRAFRPYVLAMNASQSQILRRAGAASLAGAAFTIAGSVVIGVAQATSDVPESLYRAPLSHGAFVALAVYAALTHLPILGALIGLRRSEVAGTSNWARLGLGAALAGTTLLFACEWATIPLVDRHDNSTAAVIVDSLFGLATILVTAGMIAVGRATLRSGRLRSWRRWAPLACGLLSLVVIPIQFTSVVWLGVGIYGIGYAILGAALVTDPTAAVEEPALQATTA
jgi:hypothetical protein